MGVYYAVACHRCREWLVPSRVKLREIEACPEAAAEIGRFMVEHAGHPCELVGDYDGPDGWDRLVDYRKVKAPAHTPQQAKPAITPPTSGGKLVP